MNVMQQNPAQDLIGGEGGSYLDYICFHSPVLLLSWISCTPVAMHSPPPGLLLGQVHPRVVRRASGCNNLTTSLGFLLANVNKLLGKFFALFKSEAFLMAQSFPTKLAFFSLWISHVAAPRLRFLLVGALEACGLSWWQGWCVVALLPSPAGWASLVGPEQRAAFCSRCGRMLLICHLGRCLFCPRVSALALLLALSLLFILVLLQADAAIPTSFRLLSVFVTHPY